MIALAASSALAEPISTVPSSCMSTVAFVASTIPRIVLPPGPITAPILSVETIIFCILGAKGLTSDLTSGMADVITSST